MAMAIRGGCGFDLEGFDASAFPMLSQYTANPYRKPLPQTPTANPYRKPYCRDAARRVSR